MTHRHNITLDTHTASTLRAYGGGNLSQGIRRAAELVRQWEEANAHPNSNPNAPEMLEMLEEIALQINLGQDISEWYSEIVDTIEKARGETP